MAIPDRAVLLNVPLTRAERAAFNATAARRKMSARQLARLLLLEAIEGPIAARRPECATSR